MLQSYDPEKTGPVVRILPPHTRENRAAHEDERVSAYLSILCALYGNGSRAMFSMVARTHSATSVKLFALVASLAKPRIGAGDGVGFYCVVVR